MTNGQTPVAATAAATAAGTFKDELDDFERFALENLVRNEWGLKVATLNRLMCKYLRFPHPPLVRRHHQLGWLLVGIKHAAMREAACLVRSHPVAAVSNEWLDRVPSNTISSIVCQAHKRIININHPPLCTRTLRKCILRFFLSNFEMLSMRQNYCDAMSNIFFRNLSKFGYISPTSGEVLPSFDIIFLFFSFRKLY